MCSYACSHVLSIVAGKTGSELNVKAGDKLTLLEDKSPWLKVKNAASNIGYVPANYCKITAVELQPSTSTSSTTTTTTAAQPSKATAPHDDKQVRRCDRPANIVHSPQQVKALFAFTASIPHSISFEVGDVFDLLPGGDATWYKARNTRSGESGFIPINYVEKIAAAAAVEKGPAKIEKRDSSAGFSPSDILSVKLNKAARPTPAKEPQPAAQPDALGVKLHPARPRPDPATTAAASSSPAAKPPPAAATKQPGDDARTQLAQHASQRAPAPRAAARPTNTAATPQASEAKADVKPDLAPAQQPSVVEHEAAVVDAPVGSELHKYGGGHYLCEV